METVQWIEAYQRLVELAPKLPNTKLVYMTDRMTNIAALIWRELS